MAERQRDEAVNIRLPQDTVERIEQYKALEKEYEQKHAVLAEEINNHKRQLHSAEKMRTKLEEECIRLNEITIQQSSALEKASVTPNTVESTIALEFETYRNQTEQQLKEYQMTGLSDLVGLSKTIVYNDCRDRKPKRKRVTTTKPIVATIVINNGFSIIFG